MFCFKSVLRAGQLPPFLVRRHRIRRADIPFRFGLLLESLSACHQPLSTFTDDDSKGAGGVGQDGKGQAEPKQDKKADSSQQATRKQVPADSEGTFQKTILKGGFAPI